MKFRFFKKDNKPQQEVKGFYGGDDNSQNIFLSQLYSLRQELISFGDVGTLDFAELYKNNAQVRGIVDKIADSVATLIDHIELQDPKKKVIEDHWILKLLERPNDRYSKKKFIKAWAINMLLYGEAFVYFKKGTGLDYGRASQAYIMQPDKVEVISGGPLAPIRGYKLSTSPEINVDLNPTNTMHSFVYNIDELSLRGLSKLKSAANDTTILESAKQRQNTSMIQGGVANIITPMPTDIGVTEIDAKKLDKELNNGKRVNGTLPLSKPVEVHRLGDKPADIGVSQAVNDAVTALCFVFNIPVDLYLGQAKYENAKIAKQALYTEVSIPLFSEFLDDLNNFFRLKEKIVLNTDNIEVLQDTSVMLSNLSEMRASINELRSYMKYPRIDQKWADEPIMKMSDSVGVVLDINENE